MYARVICILNFVLQIHQFRRIVRLQNVVGLRVVTKAEENVCRCIQQLHQHHCHPQRIQVLVLRSLRVRFRHQRLLRILPHRHQISHRVNRANLLRQLHLALQYIHHRQHHLCHHLLTRQTNQAHYQPIFLRCHRVTLLRQSQRYHHQISRPTSQAHLRLFLQLISQAVLHRLSPAHLLQLGLAVLLQLSQQCHRLHHRQACRLVSQAHLHQFLQRIDRAVLHLLSLAALLQLGLAVLLRQSQRWHRLHHHLISQL